MTLNGERNIVDCDEVAVLLAEARNRQDQVRRRITLLAARNRAGVRHHSDTLRGVARRPMMEDLRERVLPVPEDTLDIAAHQTRRQPRHPRQVFDLVDHARGRAGRLEAVFVAPPQIGTGRLPIDEPPARLPHLDARGPGNRQSVKTDAVSISTPARITIGSGVTIENRSQGGVSRSRFDASAKNANVVSSDAGTSAS